MPKAKLDDMIDIDTNYPFERAKWKIVNDYDPNNEHGLTSETLIDALLEALGLLGWKIVKEDTVNWLKQAMAIWNNQLTPVEKKSFRKFIA